MNFATAQTALVTWVLDYSGLTAVWANEARPMTDKPFVVLQILRSGEYGNYERKYIYNVGTQKMEPTVSQERDLTLNVQVISRNQTANNNALFYLDKLKLSLGLESVQIALSNAGLNLFRRESTIVLDAIFQNRSESRASFDVIFGYKAVTEFGDAEATEYIDTVEISSEIENEAGDLLDEDVQFDEDIFGVPV